MSAGANHRPTQPIEHYPEAELAPPPPVEAPGAPAAEPAAKPVRAPAERAVLQFLDPASIRTTVPLKFGFVWEGAEVTEIPVRRLSVAEVGDVVEAMPEGAPYDLYDFLAAMTGFPPPVLRGLMDDDGQELLARARPFCPRDVEAMFWSPTSAPGADMPSPPPEG